jgi:hypothetical protein
VTSAPSKSPFAAAQAANGDFDGALVTLEEAHARAVGGGDAARAEQLAEQRARYGAARPSGAARAAAPE